MLFAGFGTAIAGFGTHAAQLSVQVRIACHESGAEVARISTVAAEFDALSHHLHHVAV